MKTKKVILFPVLLIILAMMLFSVSAAEQTQSGSIFVVNPLYENCVVQPQVAAYNTTQPTAYYTTEEAVVAQIRTGWENRESTIVVGYQGTKNIETIANNLLGNILKHTGVPTQGDYLMWHYSTYRLSWRTENTTNKTVFTCQMTYLSTAAQEAAVDTQVAVLLKAMDLAYATDYDKVCAIYDYLCQNITYDTYGLNIGDNTAYTAYAALVKKSAVCQGYSSLFYRLALEMDVDTRVIAGIGNGGPHGWNIVKLGDCYYNLDATWDSEISQNGQAYQYFLKASRNFDDHMRNAEYDTTEFHRSYPMSANDYKPVALKLIAQPANVVAPSGKSASVTVKATGDGLTYNWYHKNTTASKFAKANVTGATYCAYMSDSSNGRYVYCIVRDQYGNQIKTNTVRLYMGNPLKITAQPANGAAPSGKTASVTVKATGDGLTYTWYHRNANASKFAKAGTTGATYSANMSSSSHGRYVYCIVKDKFGSSMKTDTVRLYVGNPVKITAQPKTGVAPSGKTAAVTVKATGDGLTYTWYHKNATASKFAKAGATGATYSAKMSSSGNGRYVYCVVSDKYGNQIKTEVVRLYMGNTVKIATQPKTVTVAKNAKATVTVKATGDGLTYTWYHKNATASKFAKANVTGASYSAYMSSSTNGRYVYCIVTDKYGNQIKTNTVALKMK